MATQPIQADEADEQQLYLVFRNRFRRAVLDTITLDASINEVHAGEVDVTEQPVETGANVSDHARPKAETVTIEGVVSNTPIPIGNDPSYQRRADQEFLLGIEGRAHEAFRALRDLKDAGTPITIVTALHEYPNMVMIKLEVPRNASIGDALHFTAAFRQIRLVSSQTVKAPTKVTGAKPLVKGGKKDTKSATPAVKKSALASIEDSINDGSAKKFVPNPILSLFGQ